MDGILDGIGDFGQTENEILDSMFVQSLLSYLEKPACIQLHCSAEMKDIASTSVQKAHLAKYKDNIASAMQAQFSNILQEVNCHCTLIRQRNVSKMFKFCHTEWIYQQVSKSYDTGLSLVA